ncbi:hypothetical protein ACROYT_G043199 [Oculina patagonica]
MAAKQEQELSLFELASAKLSDAQEVMTKAGDSLKQELADAQNLMAEARGLLKQDLDNVRQEKSAIEEFTKTLNQVHFASAITLNVGALKGIPDRKSFLFTLVNPSGNEPVKITPRLRDGGIMCDIDMGPSFGSSTTGYDLVVWNHNASTSLFNLGCGFTCPENASNTTYFTGKNPSEISELEVFKVSLKNPLEL